VLPDRAGASGAGTSGGSTGSPRRPRTTTPRAGTPRAGGSGARTTRAPGTATGKAREPQRGATRRAAAGAASGPSYRGTRDEERPLPTKAKSWGNVARRGAREVGRSDRDVETPARGFHSAAATSARGGRTLDERERRRGTPRPSSPTPWVRDDGSRDEWQDPAPGGARKRARTPGRAPDPNAPRSAAEAMAALSPRHPLPPEIATDIRNAADAATALHKERLVERAESAYGAYERGRYQDALRAIKPVADEAPGVAAVRELTGLAAYRAAAGVRRPDIWWRFGALSDSTEHLPVLMDCTGAHKPKRSPNCGASSPQLPDADTLAEGEDRGRGLTGRTRVTSTVPSPCWRPRRLEGVAQSLRRHVRQWYLLADLYGAAATSPRRGSTSSGCWRA